MVQCVEFSGNLGAEMEYNIVSSPNCPPRIDKKNHRKSGYCLNDTILMFYLLNVELLILVSILIKRLYKIGLMQHTYFGYINILKENDFFNRFHVM